MPRPHHARAALGWLLILIAPALHALPADLAEALRDRERAPVLVVLPASPLPLRDAPSAPDLRALRRTTSRGRAALAARIPALALEGAVTELWAAGTLALEADRATLEALTRDPGVERVIPDGPVPLPRAEPVDGVKDEVGPYTWGQDRMGIPVLRELYGLDGSGQRIGLIDTGVDPDHPDLAGKVVAYRDFVSPGSPPRDPVGHGTHVAGTLVGGASTGVSIGVAPAAELLAARALGGSGGKAELLAAMQWMLDPDGDPATDDAPGVVSMSWHTGPGDQTPFQRTMDVYVAAGIAPVFSAGNMGPDGGITNPKRYPTSITVGATDVADQVARFSSRGPIRYQGGTLRKPEWTAPGVEVFSARPGGGYRYMNGTSMAAPHCAGLIALLRQADPTLAVNRLRAALAGTAADLGRTGWDGAYGAGRLDGVAALGALVEFGTVRVRGASAVPPAPFATLRVDGGSRVFEAGEDGALEVHLLPGTHSLHLTAFGHEEVELTVTLAAGQRLERRLNLRRAGTWTNAVLAILDATGAPLEGARVDVLEAPMPARTSDAAGRIALELPPGRRALRVHAPGHASRRVDLVLPAPPLEVRLRARGEVLLVDDDTGERLDRYVDDALERLGLRYDVFERTRGPLAPEVLAEYPVAIWIFGTDARGTLTPLDQDLVRGYLEAGGKLVVSGQDLAYDLRRTDFLRRTLRTWYDKDNAGVFVVEGLGLRFAIDGGDGASNQDAPDRLTPMFGADGVFTYEGATRPQAGHVYKDQLMVLGFGLEAVTPAATRAELVGRILARLQGEEPDHGADALARHRRRRAAFR